MSARLDFDAGSVPPLEPIADLKARADILDIVGRYVDLSKKGRPYERWSRCPLHDDRTPSFKVDTRTERFKCFGCGRGGDVLDFLAVAERLDPVEAIKRLVELVGTGHAARPVIRPPAADEPEPEAEERRELALEVWRQAEDVWPGTGLPWRYLRERRGIVRWSHDRLRWHPSCPWRGGRAGCIVAPVNDHATGLVTAIWRILPALEGEVRRRGLGPMRGNACRLFRADGPQLVLAEGVEDALAARELTGLPAWAALSAGNMAALVLPGRFREVLILADRDANGVGQENAHKLAARLRVEGRHAEVRRSTVGKDANDALRARRVG